MMDYAPESPPSFLNDYDAADRDSSSSSSGGDHSSPSEELNSPNPALGTTAWPYHPLSLALPDLSLAPRHSDAFASLKLAANSPPAEDPDLLTDHQTLGPEFWSSSAVHVKPEPTIASLHDIHLVHSRPDDHFDAEMHDDAPPAAGARPPPAAAAAAAAPSQDDLLVPSTNLVAKDAVVASASIPLLVTPPRQSPGQLQLLVLGVPVVGAKSRVETQIKISLVLVTPRILKPDPSSNGVDHSPVMAPDGDLVDGVGDRLARVGSWSHIRLPKLLALKKKNKKQLKPDPPAEETLYLDVAVVRGSEPHDEIFICAGCQQREHKRAQRKKDARAPQAQPLPADDERRKVVVFNCAEIVEFADGEVILPTRITCYCRHHKERKGFSVGFSLRNASGALVASGATPPIMITDDHKTSMRPPPMSTASISIPSTPTVVPTPSPSTFAPTVKADPDPLSSARAARPSRPTSRKSSPRPSTSPETRPKRAASGRAKAVPYDSDARPKKRIASGGSHRSPSFAMTPLVMSKQGSPVHSPPAQLAPAPATAQHSSQAQQLADVPAGAWEDSSSALGLVTGMDSFMNDQYPGSYGSYSATTSSAPSPSSAGWRSTASSPPLSASNSVDNFTAFFSQLPDQPLPPPRSGNASPLGAASEADAFASLYTHGFGSGPVPSSPGTQAVHPLQMPNPPAPAHPVATLNWFPTAPPPPAPPRISRLIPGEGPVSGGIEVTVLGENFVPDLVCIFGDAPAVPTHYWSANTLVCVLPPSANPGPVVVGIKGVPLTVEEGTGLQLFTYKDDSDRSLLELALQVVGLKMTGRLEDASAVAMRIIGTNPTNSAATSPQASHHASPTDLAGLALRTGSAYTDNLGSRPSSRRASMVRSVPAGASFPPLEGGETRNFEGIVIKFLSLLDLEAHLIPGAAPSLPRARPPVSHSNAQRHTLLHLATVLGFHRLAAFLIARRIDLNQPDRNGFTALHFASLYGRVAIARMLLEAGAASYARNLAGMTALDIARERDDVDIEEVFRRLRPARATVDPASQHRRQLSRTSSFTQPVRVPVAVESSDDESAPESASDSDSFHSSDEDASRVSDLERGGRVSRNPSLVSLRYLLDAEADVYAEYEPEMPYDTVGRVLPSEFDSEEQDDDTGSSVSEGSLVEDDDPEEHIIDEKKLHALAHLDKKVALPAPPMATSVRDYASASSAWLSNLKPTIPFAPPKLPLSSNIQDAWEKMQANPVWERTRQAWYAPKEATLGRQSAATAPQDIKGAWMSHWLGQPKSPPPMYSVADLHPSPNSSPKASTSTLTAAPPPPSKLAIQAQLKRRVGYAPEHITDSLVQSFVHHETKMRKLKDDRMLAFFWIPVLLIVTFFFIYSSYSSEIAPFVHSAIDTLLPTSFSRALRV